MIFKEDNTYNEMREGSMMQWLDQLMDGEDIVNKAGAKLTKEYISMLNGKIKELEEKNAMKDKFLKKMKRKTMEK